MLKGSNRLVFNEATMQEIVGFYLRNKMLNSDEPVPVVKHVKVDHDGMFNIGLGEPEHEVVRHRDTACTDPPKDRRVIGRA